jgi:hypothetical protein
VSFVEHLQRLVEIQESVIENQDFTVQGHLFHNYFIKIIFHNPQGHFLVLLASKVEKSAAV